MNKIDIIEKTTQELDIILTKEYLVENYIIKNIPYSKIAYTVGCDPMTVKKRLLKFGINIKSFSVALRGRRLGPRTEEHKRKIGEHQKNKTKHTKESKGKISQGLKGKKRLPFSREWRKNISKGMLGKNKGKRRTEKTLKKILSKIQASPNSFEIRCINYLNSKYANKFRYTGDGSFILVGYSPDAYSEELKTVCLFQGNYWHCNPRMYESSYYNQMLKKKAQEVWERDKKIVEAFEKAGYKVIIIWEDGLIILGVNQWLLE